MNRECEGPGFRDIGMGARRYIYGHSLVIITEFRGPDETTSQLAGPLQTELFSV